MTLFIAEQLFIFQIDFSGLPLKSKANLKLLGSPPGPRALQKSAQRTIQSFFSSQQKTLICSKPKPSFRFSLSQARFLLGHTVKDLFFEPTKKPIG